MSLPATVPVIWLSAMAPHDCYKAAGDSEQWVSIAVATETEWHSLCQTIGQPGLANDPYASLKSDFQIAKQVIAAQASAQISAAGRPERSSAKIGETRGSFGSH